MGVEGLFNIIRKYAPGAQRECKLSELSGCTVAVDASIFVYKWASVGIANEIKNPAGDYINHLQGIYFMTAGALLVGVNLIYVFEGRPPVMKTDTLQARKIARRDGAVKIPMDMFGECKKVLEYMGVPYIDAVGEAEATCAWLAQNGVVDLVASEDSDCIVYPGVTLARGFNTRKLTIIDRNKLINGLKLSSGSFIDFCILLGTDYNKPIMSPVKAYNAIKKYTRADLIPDISVPAIDEIRELYMSPMLPPVIHFGRTSYDHLEHYLLCENLLSENRIGGTMEKLRLYRRKIYCIYGFPECKYFTRAIAVAGKRFLNGEFKDATVSVYSMTKEDYVANLAIMKEKFGIIHNTSPLITLLDGNDIKYIGGYEQWLNYKVENTI